VTFSSGIASSKDSASSRGSHSAVDGALRNPTIRTNWNRCFAVAVNSREAWFQLSLPLDCPSAKSDNLPSIGVFVTLDLIGVLQELRTAVAEQAREKYQLPPASLLMNASHTHCGPAYGNPQAKDYFDSLKVTLVELIGLAIERLEPATLSYSFARASLAMNRRSPTDAGYRNHPNPEGPIDHSVPVLSVKNAAGDLRAVVFGYACHNTTMGFRKWLGDYAGYAQEYFEKDHPSVTALFMMGCGGDQNPYPRSQGRDIAKYPTKVIGRENRVEVL
jgi:neutral ceramidase